MDRLKVFFAVFTQEVITVFKLNIDSMYNILSETLEVVDDFNFHVYNPTYASFDRNYRNVFRFIFWADS